MVYHFIWGDGKGLPWWRMIMPKAEGGLGLKDLHLLSKLGTIYQASDPSMVRRELDLGSRDATEVYWRLKL